MKGEKDSEQYKKYLNYLNMLVDIEKEYYSNINIDFYKLADIISTILYTQNISPDIFHDNENIFDQEYDKEIAIRMCKKLFNILKKDKIKFQEIDPVLVEKMNESENVRPVIDSLINDTLKRFLYFLEKDIDNEKNINIKNSLIKAKYSTSFLNDEIENINLYNDFSISDECIILNDISLNSQNYKECRNILTLNELNNQIGSVLEINDVDYYYNEKIVSLILRLSYVKSSLSLLDDNIFDAFCDSYYKYLEFTEVSDENNISKQLIENCLNERKNNILKKKTL